MNVFPVKHEKFSEMSESFEILMVFKYSPKQFHNSQKSSQHPDVGNAIERGIVCNKYVSSLNWTGLQASKEEASHLYLAASAYKEPPRISQADKSKNLIKIRLTVCCLVNFGGKLPLRYYTTLNEELGGARDCGETGGPVCQVPCPTENNYKGHVLLKLFCAGPSLP